MGYLPRATAARTQHDHWRMPLPLTARHTQKVDAFNAAHIHGLDQSFYVCGPPGFVESINTHLLSLGVHPDRLVYEC
ncbi:hypothetical protein [Allochromatium palmeri]|uniref:hypothetical protein n=1 Tax=Allochromatium palmeri TaxID=231048 RepID=UPI0016436605|nr:hypothetical protein [Allochromatium palmeri]